MNPDFEGAVEALRECRHLVVFTGAGVSAESGVPTFRDDDGFWRRFPMEEFGRWRGLVRKAFREPRRLAEYIGCVLQPIADAQPNRAHRAIAEAQSSIDRLTVVTQNIDRLHQRAGSNTVFEVHGSLFTKCGIHGEPRGEVSHAKLQEVCRGLRRAETGWAPLLRLLLALRPLMGLGMRGVYRPAVVMFGDALAEPAWTLAQRAVETCDCLLQIGTSGAVYPAALLPDEAARVGATTIAVDPEPQQADIWLRGTACEVIPPLFDQAFGDGEGVLASA